MKYYPLICRCASNYHKRHSHISYEVSDLISEAYLVKPDLTKKYQPEKGCSFESYLWTKLNIHYSNICRKEYALRIEYHAPEMVPEVARANVAYPPAFIVELSHQAKLYLQTVIDGGEELENYLQTASKRIPYKYAVGCFLGWGFDNVRVIEKEITKKLIC